MAVYIGAIDKDKKRELIKRANELTRVHAVNFIDSRVADEWNKNATRLINEMQLLSKSTKADMDFFKKVKYDTFKILEYYLKKLKK